MKKQGEKTEQTKQSLLDAFCMVYSKKPIEKITIQEITKKQVLTVVRFINTSLTLMNY